MKGIIILAFILNMGLNTMAGDGKSFLMLRSGLSVPVGKYGSNYVDGASYTTIGMSFGGEGAWFFKDYLGVGVDVNYTFHTVNVSALGGAMVASDPFLEDIYIRSEPYTMLSFTAGLYSSIDITQKISIQPKLTGGIMFGKTPFQLFEPTYFMLGPEYFKITSSRANGFVIKTGVSIKYSINDCIAVGINSDYSYSPLKFGFITSEGFEYRKKNISFFDFSLGLVIKL